MDVGIGYIPIFAVIVGVIWAIRGLANFGRWAQEEIKDKLDSQK